MAEEKYNRKNPAVKRILQELKEMQSNPSDDFMSLPLEVLLILIYLFFFFFIWILIIVRFNFSLGFIWKSFNGFLFYLFIYFWLGGLVIVDDLSFFWDGCDIGR